MTRRSEVERHGMSNTPTYSSWANMIDRCHNPNNPKYKYYGGNGIVVCEKWKCSFVKFLADMGERPSGLTIDRLDNKRGYEPENCRWATWEEQATNRSRSRGTMAEKERYELKLDAGDNKRVERIREWLKNDLGLDVPKSEAIRYAIRSFDTEHVQRKSR